jgi:hypothetical protein
VLNGKFLKILYPLNFLTKNSRKFSKYRIQEQTPAAVPSLWRIRVFKSKRGRDV